MQLKNFACACIHPRVCVYVCACLRAFVRTQKVKHLDARLDAKGSLCQDMAFVQGLSGHTINVHVISLSSAYLSYDTKPQHFCGHTHTHTHTHNPDMQL